MPTYDYECDACGHTWELFQAITADPISKCPGCGKKKARRLFGTGAALMFKGSGFYETDYRSESYKKSAKAEQSSSDSNTSSGTEKTDSNAAKPDSKADSRTELKSDQPKSETSRPTDRQKTKKSRKREKEN